jgi:hypothetical protein
MKGNRFVTYFELRSNGTGTNIYAGLNLSHIIGQALSLAHAR